MRIDLVGLHCILVLQYTAGTSDKEFLASVNNNGNNIAFHKSANQDSTYNGVGFPASAEKAVDGLAKGDFFAESCTHTWGKMSHNVWWEVDLQQQFRIGSIRILNRNDNQNDIRLHDVTITVYQNKSEPRTQKNCTTHTGSAGPGWLNLTCDSSVTGRYVRISKPVVIDEGDQLSLCEVEIYEASTPPTSMHLERKTLTPAVTGNKKQMVPQHCARKYVVLEAALDLWLRERGLKTSGFSSSITDGLDD